MPSLPSMTAIGAGIDDELRLGDRLADPGLRRATYQDRRITPCDWWPQRSAWTSVSAASRASASGMPART